MGKVENYTKFAETIARDDSHGYDQTYRWGTPDYDCSSLVIDAVTSSGINVKGNGATYTGNMLSTFLKCGFKDVTKSVNRNTGSGLQRGDVLLNIVHHTAIYCGNGQMVDARSNEFGGARGGKKGDQTGHEIEIHAYRNYPWDNVLRYEESSAAPVPTTTLLQYGSKGNAVKTLQTNLNTVLKSGLVVDGDFGIKTWNAVVSFQTKYGLVVDGIYGEKSDAKMKSVLGGTSKPTANVQYIVKTAARVRVGAGTNYDQISAKYPGDKITITETRNGWGHILNSGWISLDLCKKA